MGILNPPIVKLSGQSLFDRLDGVLRLGAVRASRLRHFRASATSFAADGRRASTDQIDRTHLFGDIRSHPNNERGFSFVHRNQGCDAGTQLFFHLIDHSL